MQKPRLFTTKKLINWYVCISFQIMYYIIVIEMMDEGWIFMSLGWNSTYIISFEFVVLTLDGSTSILLSFRALLFWRTSGSSLLVQRNFFDSFWWVPASFISMEFVKKLLARCNESLSLVKSPLAGDHSLFFKHNFLRVLELKQQLSSSRNGREKL